MLESIFKLVDESSVKMIPEKIDDQIVLFLNKYGSKKVYFDEYGWKTCIDTMTCRKRQCETCQSFQVQLFASVLAINGIIMSA